MVTRITRSTRVIMLLTSYLDARPGLLSSGGDYVRTSKPGSSTPQKGYLWDRGSYPQLEEALEEMSLVSRQRLFKAYIDQPDRRRRVGQLIYRKKNAKELARDVDDISKNMPRDIHVPRDIIENWQDYVAPPKRSSDEPAG